LRLSLSLLAGDLERPEPADWAPITIPSAIYFDLIRVPRIIDVVAVGVVGVVAGQAVEIVGDLADNPYVGSGFSAMPANPQP